MPRAYFSIVLDHPVDSVWSTIRPFDHYVWAGVPGDTIIEDGRQGDQVGSIRRVSTAAGTLRQILLAHSDAERSYTYAIVGDLPVPARNYLATIRVTPVTEDERSFVEWWATFDCDLQDGDRLLDHFQVKGFKTWLGALRSFMGGRADAGVVI